MIHIDELDDQFDGCTSAGEKGNMRLTALALPGRIGSSPERRETVAVAQDLNDNKIVISAPRMRIELDKDQLVYALSLFGQVVDYEEKE